MCNMSCGSKFIFSQIAASCLNPFIKFFLVLRFETLPLPYTEFPCVLESGLISHFVSLVSICQHNSFNYYVSYLVGVILPHYSYLRVFLALLPISL